MKDKDKTAIDFAVALKTYCRDHGGVNEGWCCNDEYYNQGCPFFRYDNEGYPDCEIGWPCEWEV